MRKLFLGLLVLASGLFNVQKAAAWAVTDTVVADGYYYICSNYISDGVKGKAIAGKGNIVTASPGGEYAHMTVLYIQPFSKLASEWQSNLNSIFRITRDADGMYHIKSMREGKDTYFYPNQIIGGNTGYLWATGRDNDRYYFRTMDWGGSKNKEGYQYILNRKDSQSLEPTPCIHCGRCVENCPLGLNPTAYAAALEVEDENERFELLRSEEHTV